MTTAEIKLQAIETALGWLDVDLSNEGYVYREIQSIIEAPRDTIWCQDATCCAPLWNYEEICPVCGLTQIVFHPAVDAHRSAGSL